MEPQPKPSPKRQEVLDAITRERTRAKVSAETYEALRRLHNFVAKLDW